MNKQSKADREETLLAQRAADWLARLTNGSPREHAQFLAWVRKSPVHVQEVLIASAWRAVLCHMDPQRRIDVKTLLSAATNVVPVREGHSPASHRKHGGARWLWMASLGLACMLATVPMMGVPQVVADWLDPNRYATAVGEQHAVQLVDGSVMSLNTQSRVRIDFSSVSRDVYLAEGQALFTVARDPRRPFRVHAGVAVVEAVGTKFDIHRRADRTDVAVIEGSVRVGSSAPYSLRERLAGIHERTRLAAGEIASVIEGGHITPPAPVNVAEVSAWQQRRLIFRNTPLAEVAEEFGRYDRSLLIRIDGEALREQPVSGVFDANDPESLIMALASVGSLAFEQRGREVVVRRR